MYTQKFDPVPEVKGFTNEELLMPKGQVMIWLYLCP